MSDLTVPAPEPELVTDSACAPRARSAAEHVGTARNRGSRWSRDALSAFLKRAFDALVASVLLLVLAPLLLALVVLVRLDSPGPPFFRCDRVGYRGRPIRMLKFRKMRVGASGLPLTTAQDERFTRIGRWLTAYKLDELPQLWHVATGEMSLVGPRPETREFVDLYPREYHEEILRVRPGIIGLTQLAFAEENRILRSEDPVGHYVESILPQKVGLDRLYASRRGLWLDLRILFWAVVTVILRRPVAVNRSTAALSLRRR